MFYIINIYMAVSVKGPYPTLGMAEKVYTTLQELADDGWRIVKSSDVLRGI